LKDLYSLAQNHVGGNRHEQYRLRDPAAAGPSRSGAISESKTDNTTELSEHQLPSKWSVGVPEPHSVHGIWRRLNCEQGGGRRLVWLGKGRTLNVRNFRHRGA
jgi:hypothetical protein